MGRRVASLLAASFFGGAMLVATPSLAEQPASPALGTAKMLPGGEWAISRWEGHVTSVGTNSAGGMGLNKLPRILLIEKDADGQVRCRFVSPPADSFPPSASIPKTAGLTKRCVIAPDGISLTTSRTDIELRRSGPDALQGLSKPLTGRGVVASGLSDIQVHLNRAR